MANNVVVVHGGGGVTVNTATNNPSVVVPSVGASVIVPQRTASVSTIGLRNVKVAGDGSTPIIKQITMAVTGTLNPRGLNRVLQYNDSDTAFGGANGLYYTSEGNMLVSGNSLILHGGKYKIETPPVSDDAFLIQDRDNRDLFRIDTEDKKILLTSFSDDSYYIGIGTTDPQERFHVAGGNARFDNNIIVGNDVTCDNVYGDLEFKYIKDGISFLETSVPTGGSSLWVSFGRTLGYTPKVVSSMITPFKQYFGQPETHTSQEVYFSNIGSVTTSGYFVVFSDVIRTTGYLLDTYISAKES